MRQNDRLRYFVRHQWEPGTFSWCEGQTHYRWHLSFAGKYEENITYEERAIRLAPADYVKHRNEGAEQQLCRIAFHDHDGTPWERFKKAAEDAQRFCENTTLHEDEAEEVVEDVERQLDALRAELAEWRSGKRRVFWRVRGWWADGISDHARKKDAFFWCSGARVYRVTVGPAKKKEG